MMAAAAKINVDHGAQIIDINMGCPAKKVCNVAAGSALLRDEPLVQQILEAVVNAVGTGPDAVPVTLKIRTGWDRESKGSVHLPNFVVSGWDPRVIVDVAGNKRVEQLPSISTYTYQLIAFADAVDLGKPVKTDAKDALAQSQLIDSAYLSANLPLRPTLKL
jgi:hypothetical protein